MLGRGCGMLASFHVGLVLAGCFTGIIINKEILALLNANSVLRKWCLLMHLVPSSENEAVRDLCKPPTWWRTLCLVEGALWDDYCANRPTEKTQRATFKVLEGSLVFLLSSQHFQAHCGSEGKVFACNTGDLGLNPGSGRSPGEGKGNPLQYSCLENPMDGGDWWAPVHGVAKSQTDWVTSLSLSFSTSINLHSIQHSCPRRGLSVEVEPLWKKAESSQFPKYPPPHSLSPLLG